MIRLNYSAFEVRSSYRFCSVLRRSVHGQHAVLFLGVYVSSHFLLEYHCVLKKSFTVAVARLAGCSSSVSSPQLQHGVSVHLLFSREHSQGQGDPEHGGPAAASHLQPGRAPAPPGPTTLQPQPPRGTQESGGKGEDRVSVVRNISEANEM